MHHVVLFPLESQTKTFEDHFVILKIRKHRTFVAIFRKSQTKLFGLILRWLNCFIYETLHHELRCFTIERNDENSPLVELLKGGWSSSRPRMRPVWPLFCTLQFYFNAARIFRTCALVPEQPCCLLPCLIFLLSKISTLVVRVQSYLLTYKNATNYDETWSHLLDLVWSRKMLFISTWGSQIRLHNRNLVHPLFSTCFMTFEF